MKVTHKQARLSQEVTNREVIAEVVASLESVVVDYVQKNGRRS